MSYEKQDLFHKQSMSEQLVDYIKTQILNGELNPGDRVVETKLAKELNISQTPVREALRQLQGEGIIMIVPNRGPLVCDLKIEDVFEIYSMRSVLEGLAIRLATQLATDEEIAELEHYYNEMKSKLTNEKITHLLKESFYIHDTIIRLSRHNRLMQMYKSISFQIALVNRILGTYSTKEKEVMEHWELIDALKRRDPQYAENTMRKHIYRSYCDFIEFQGQSDFKNEDNWL